MQNREINILTNGKTSVLLLIIFLAYITLLQFHTFSVPPQVLNFYIALSGDDFFKLLPQLGVFHLQALHGAQMGDLFRQETRNILIEFLGQGYIPFPYNDLHYGRYLLFVPLFHLSSVFSININTLYSILCIFVLLFSSLLIFYTLPKQKHTCISFLTIFLGIYIISYFMNGRLVFLSISLLLFVVLHIKTIKNKYFITSIFNINVFISYFIYITIFLCYFILSNINI